MSEDIDIGQISEALNDKLDRDAGNPAALGKERIVAWGMPSGTYDDVTVLSSGESYTAPANGYFCAYNANGQGGAVVLFNTTRRIGMTAPAITGISDGIGFCPAQKGDSVYLKYSGTFGIQYGFFRFVYAEGEE